jgi:hypothetical protein
MAARRLPKLCRGNAARQERVELNIEFSSTLKIFQAMPRVSKGFSQI